MKLAILGAGRIADKVSETLEQMPEIECYAVASRELARAEEFAQKHHFQKAYGSYEEMLSDPAVELVYICTPHSHHAEHMRLCIRHKKPMLCEKSFTCNEKEARAVLKEAEEAGVFCAEAIWTRYMPSRRQLNEIIRSGIIGPITTLSANLAYPITDKPRILDPALCGGALLDVGVYALNFAVMCFGEEIERLETSCSFTGTGVDMTDSITLYYKDGRTALCSGSIVARSDRMGILWGENGYIVVENINAPTKISVYDTEDRLIKAVSCPILISGYEFEFMECVRCIGEGLLEAPSMPHKDTLSIMSLMDRCREKWGLKYPQE